MKLNATTILKSSGPVFALGPEDLRAQGIAHEFVHLPGGLTRKYN